MVELNNLYGSKIKSFEIQNTDLGENNFEINFANENILQNGIYFLNLTVNGEKTIKKLLLQR